MTDKIYTPETMKSDLSIWICDADFWMDELEDCQTLLEKNLTRVDELGEKKKLDQFQNQVIYYRDELLPEYKSDLLAQKRKLDVQPFDTLLDYQTRLENRGIEIHKQMKERRRQLELFVNNI